MKRLFCDRCDNQEIAPGSGTTILIEGDGLPATPDGPLTNCLYDLCLDCTAALQAWWRSREKPKPDPERSQAPRRRRGDR